MLIWKIVDLRFLGFPTVWAERKNYIDFTIMYIFGKHFLKLLTRS